jgi:hypothetical protein
MATLGAFSGMAENVVGFMKAVQKGGEVDVQESHLR